MFSLLAFVAAFAQVATDFAKANAKVLNENADFAIAPAANFAALNRR